MMTLSRLRVVVVVVVDENDVMVDLVDINPTVVTTIVTI